MYWFYCYTQSLLFDVIVECIIIKKCILSFHQEEQINRCNTLLKYVNFKNQKKSKKTKINWVVEHPHVITASKSNRTSINGKEFQLISVSWIFVVQFEGVPFVPMYKEMTTRRCSYNYGADRLECLQEATIFLLLRRVYAFLSLV